jgi:hypothetical protein
VVVGVLFLSFTVTFFTGNTLIHSYFSSAAKPAGTLITGVLLIGLSGLADAAVGLAMRPVLAPYAPVRSQVYFVLRVAEGLAVLAVALAATSGVMAVLMLGLHSGPAITQTVTLYAFFGYCLLVIAAILALRVLVLVFRPDIR